MKITLGKTDPRLKKIFMSAFPEYRGRKFRVELLNRPINVKSYWCGGSRDWFVFIRLSDGAQISVPQQSAFDPQIPGAEAVTLPPGVVCIEHTMFCGKDLGLTLHVSPTDVCQIPDNEVKLLAERRESV